MADHWGNRYGRSEDARIKVIHAADDLLAEVGFAAVTMEGLAKRAGVAKQTIYRWWPTKADVLLSALARDADERLAPPDTGSLVDDVRAAARGLALFLLSAEEGKTLRALRAHAELDRSFATKFDVEFSADQRERELLPLRRGIERGDLPADLDLELARAALYGPIFEIDVADLSEALAITVADRWIAGYACG